MGPDFCCPDHWDQLSYGLVVTLSADNNTDLSFSRTMDLEMALSFRVFPDIRMNLNGIKSHSERYDPSGSVDVGHQHGLRW